MEYIAHYQSPLGPIFLAADYLGLTGLWFENQQYFPSCPEMEWEEGELPVFETTRYWLDLYFAGKQPDFQIPLHFIGTEFQKEVWGILNRIPYGQTTTYGEIARQIAIKRGVNRMSAQAVGGAVGHNKISIIVPCHRVVGTGGNLTGYAGGIDKKIELLTLERVDMTRFFCAEKGKGKELQALNAEIFTSLSNRGMIVP